MTRFRSNENLKEALRVWKFYNTQVEAAIMDKISLKNKAGWEWAYTDAEASLIFNQRRLKEAEKSLAAAFRCPRQNWASLK